MCSDFFLWNIKCIFTISIISQHRIDAGRWNLFLYKTSICLQVWPILWQLLESTLTSLRIFWLQHQKCWQVDYFIEQKFAFPFCIIPEQWNDVGSWYPLWKTKICRSYTVSGKVNLTFYTLKGQGTLRDLVRHIELTGPGDATVILKFWLSHPLYHLLIYSEVNLKRIISNCVVPISIGHLQGWSNTGLIYERDRRLKMIRWKNQVYFMAGQMPLLDLHTATNTIIFY